MEILIVGVVFLVAGAPFIGLAVRTFMRNRAIARWPRAEGVVLATDLESSSHRVTDQNTGLHSYTTMYTPSVRYRYRAAGRELEGKNIARSVDGCAMSHEAAEKITSKYPPQSKVEVLYDPLDPETAYLEVRVSIGAIILLGMGVLFSAIGTLVVIAWANQ